MSQWIKCSEKMPVSDSDVLCFGSYGENPDGYEYIYMGWLDKKGRWRVSDGDQENRRAKATHWQPLPSPPEESCAN